MTYCDMDGNEITATELVLNIVRERARLEPTFEGRALMFIELKKMVYGLPCEYSIVGDWLVRY